MKQLVLLRLPAAILLFQIVFIFPLKAQTKDERAFGNKSVNGKRIALVIGNADYDSGIGNLKNPVNDAADMADALTRLGFSLVGGKAQLNLSRRQMLEQIREFGSQIRQGGVGVFYFAGHGVQVDRRNYLIPITDSLKYQEDAEYEAVDVDSILREMEYAENALNILILDACRNNALPKKTRNLKDGLTEPNLKPSGVYIAFAARDGQTASENSSGRNGLYTQELLKNLETPNLRLEDIFIRTRVKVKELSKRTQEPIEYGSLDSEFYLTANKNTTPPTLIDRNNEAVFWNAIENSTDIEDFESYLKHIESGEFKGIYKSTAELKLVRLKKAKVVAAWKKFRLTAKLLLKYNDVLPFSEDLAGIYNYAKYGFIDKTGKEIIAPKYDFLEPLSEGLAAVTIDTAAQGKGTNLKAGFIDEMGREVIPIKFDWVGSFTEGFAPAKLNGKYGFIDKTGNNFTPLEFDVIEGSAEGLAVAWLNDKRGYIDMNGREVIPLNYERAFEFSEGLAAVRLNNKYGFIDKTGREVIEFRYDWVNAFSEGFAGVTLNGKHGFIDKTGKEVIPLKYFTVGSFFEGIAQVELNGKSGYIDKSGKVIIPLKYDRVWCQAFKKEGFIGVMLNGKKGFVDIYGNEYFNF